MISSVRELDLLVNKRTKLKGFVVSLRPSPMFREIQLKL